MRVVPLTGIEDARAADYRRLTDVGLRRRLEPAQGMFMAESHQVMDRAVAAGYPVRSVLTTERWLPDVEALFHRHQLDAPVLVADEAVVDAITGYRVHRGALAAMERPPLPPVEAVVASTRRLLVLEGLVDHTNVGAVVRSAAGLGFDGLLVDPTCADPLYRRAVRVSMGAVFTLPWTRCVSWPDPLDSLRLAGWRLVAMTPRASAQSLLDFALGPDDRVALLLGTEGAGLSAEALAAVTDHVRIPMAPGVDSLNVAAAAAVACFALGVGGGRAHSRGDRMTP